MLRTSPPEADQIRSLHYKYEIPEETIKKLIADGYRFLEMEKAALLSCLSDESIEDILAMRKQDPWGIIQKKLDLTPEVYHQRFIAFQARKLHRFYGMEETRAAALLEEGYPLHWIRLSYLLEQHTDQTLETIIHSRTKAEKWKPWAEKHLGVSPEDFTKWIAETRNPSLPVK